MLKSVKVLLLTHHMFIFLFSHERLPHILYHCGLYVGKLKKKNMFWWTLLAVCPNRIYFCLPMCMGTLVGEGVVLCINS